MEYESLARRSHGAERRPGADQLRPDRSSELRAWAARLAAAMLALLLPLGLAAQDTNKPVLHGQDWVAITGKPLAATAGAMTFQRGGNAVDAACAMLAATSTMWDVLGWGGETQALIYDPEADEVVGINALGVAPTGATVEFFRERDMDYPPGFGPLAAVTPGTPGGLLTMLAEYGRLSLAEVLEPAIRMADGYPIERQTADAIERHKERIKEWEYSRDVFLPHLGAEGREAPYPGEIFRQPDLAATLRKLVEAEREALEAGASREEAIYAAYERFYEGDIAEEFVRGAREEGALISLEDLANWQVRIEEPVTTDYKGIDVYKLTSWTQGPVKLQMLNILENFDLQAMGYNSARYVHTVTQAMNLAFADRDFYYGDPYFPPDTPLEGLLSKEYAAERAQLIDPERTDPDARPGDPYAFMGEANPFADLLEAWPPADDREEAEDGNDREEAAPDAPDPDGDAAGRAADSPGPLAGAAGPSPSFRDEVVPAHVLEELKRGTTSIQAVDAEGWVVSITPSGAWIPAVIAGETGVGMSQRMQSFVLDEAENPYNVLEPGKRPRATLTPSLALRDGQPFLSYAIQGGDFQDQDLLQMLLNMVEFDFNVQQAAEAANFRTLQLRASFGDHEFHPRVLQINREVPSWVRAELEEKGYELVIRDKTSGPLNAVWFDWEHGTFWGGSSDFGEDWGVAW